MSINNAINASKAFARDNSTTILTAVGLVGVVTTAALAHRAALRADLVMEAYYRQNPDLSPETRKDELILKTKRTWKIYIPTLSSAAVTCTAIVMANRIGSKRAAAVAAAYTLSERAFDEYRSKVVEKLGEKKSQELKDSLAQSRVNADYEKNAKYAELYVEGSDKVLCHDAYSGRFFYSTVETIKQAVNTINREINQNDSATISDFYDVVGLQHTSISDEFGWNHAEALSLEWSTCSTPDGRAAMSYDFGARPILRPWSAASFR